MDIEWERNFGSILYVQLGRRMIAYNTDIQSKTKTEKYMKGIGGAVPVMLCN